MDHVGFWSESYHRVLCFLRGLNLTVEKETTPEVGCWTYEHAAALTYTTHSAVKGLSSAEDQIPHKIQ